MHLPFISNWFYPMHKQNVTLRECILNGTVHVRNTNIVTSKIKITQNSGNFTILKDLTMWNMPKCAFARINPRKN